MKTATLLLSLLLSACVAPLDEITRAGTLYDVPGFLAGVAGRDIEKAYMDSVNANQFLAAGADFDQPPRLIKAPQPLRNSENRHAQGVVVVRIFFDETGSVEKTAILSSTADPMIEAVESAVAQWKITPVTQAGKPAKLLIRQPFRFYTSSRVTPLKNSDSSAGSGQPRIDLWRN